MRILSEIANAFIDFCFNLFSIQPDLENFPVEQDIKCLKAWQFVFYLGLLFI